MVNLRTVPGLNQAHEWLFEKQRGGEIDNKTADAMNTTLKGSIYLNVKLRLDTAKLLLQARIKKVELPGELVEDLTSLVSKDEGRRAIE
jgi:hypothetical protein